MAERPIESQESWRMTRDLGRYFDVETGEPLKGVDFDEITVAQPVPPTSRAPLLRDQPRMPNTRNTVEFTVKSIDDISLSEGALAVTYTWVDPNDGPKQEVTKEIKGFAIATLEEFFENKFTEDLLFPVTEELRRKVLRQLRFNVEEIRNNVEKMAAEVDVQEMSDEGEEVEDDQEMATDGEDDENVDLSNDRDDSDVADDTGSQSTPVDEVDLTQGILVPSHDESSGDDLVEEEMERDDEEDETTDKTTNESVEDVSDQVMNLQDEGAMTKEALGDPELAEIAEDDKENDHSKIGGDEAADETTDERTYEKRAKRVTQPPDRLNPAHIKSDRPKKALLSSPPSRPPRLQEVEEPRRQFVCGDGESIDERTVGARRDHSAVVLDKRRYDANGQLRAYLIRSGQGTSWVSAARSYLMCPEKVAEYELKNYTPIHDVDVMSDEIETVAALLENGEEDAEGKLIELWMKEAGVISVRNDIGVVSKCKSRCKQCRHAIKLLFVLNRVDDEHYNLFDGRIEFASQILAVLKPDKAPKNIYAKLSPPGCGGAGGVFTTEDYEREELDKRVTTAEAEAKKAVDDHKGIHDKIMNSIERVLLFRKQYRLMTEWRWKRSENECCKLLATTRYGDRRRKLGRFFVIGEETPEEEEEEIFEYPMEVPSAPPRTETDAPTAKKQKKADGQEEGEVV